MDGIIDKSKKVLIVDKAGILRPVLGAILRDLGFKNIVTAQSGREALQIIKNHETSWVFSYLYKDDECHGLHLLRTCLSQARLRSVRISLFFDESEQDLVRIAYSLGMLSDHDSHMSPTHLRENIRELVGMLRHATSSTLVAGEMFGRFLTRKKMYGELCALTEKMTRMFPHDGQQYLKLAEALFLSGQNDEAGSILFQSLLFGPEISRLANEISNRYLGHPLKSSDHKVRIENCVILDTDASVQTQVRGFLEKIGGRRIVAFDNANDALTYIGQQKNVNLIITEWRQPKISGSVFIQRVREVGGHDIPIVIHSSLVNAGDNHLLKEFGVSSVIKKPSDEITFLAAVLSTVFQSRFPSEAISMENRIRLLLRSNEINEARQLAQTFLKLPSASPAQKLAIQAEFDYISGDYEHCHERARTALRMNTENLAVLNVLGKCCIRLNRLKESLKYFNAAKALSPQNVERLCLISNVHRQLGDNETAQQELKQAAQVDGSSVLVKEAWFEASKENDQGSMEEGQDLLGSLDNFGSLVSFWNNKAVTLVKNQQFDEAITMYKRALLALPKGGSPTRSVLRYNLSLAYIRAGKPKKARIYLETLVIEKASPLLPKIASLHRRLIDHLERKVPMRLYDVSEFVSNEQGESLVSSDLLPIFEVKDLGAGEIGLYGLYFFTGDLPKEFAGLLHEENVEQEDAWDQEGGLAGQVKTA